MLFSSSLLHFVCPSLLTPSATGTRMISPTLSSNKPLSPAASDTIKDCTRRRRRNSQNHGLDNHNYDKDPIGGAIERYKQMVIIHNGGGGSFSKLAFAPVLKACAKAFAIIPGKQIHAQSFKFALSSDVFVQTSLMAMYSSCGQLETALELFGKMPRRNVVSWTTLMDSYLRLEKPEMALLVFQEMQKAGSKPDDFAIVSVLTACARLGALNLGKWVHVYIKRMNLELTGFTGTALIDMYCKCGSVDEGLAVFRLIKRKNVRSWNAMLHGLSVNGYGKEALRLFSDMEMDNGARPNDVTFVGVLCGCSHNGLVEEGRFCFNLMQNKYGIEPNVKHYGCMVDLLGRAGLLDEAFEMVSKMPIPPNAVVLGALLSACRAKKNLNLAERVYQRIIQTQNSSIGGDTSHHVIMSKMYTAAGLEDKMAEARVQVGKKPKGWSSIEIGCDVHQFAVGEASHPVLRQIMEMLGDVVEKVGNGCGKEDDDDFNPHSERLAVAFGLLSTNGAAPIRIVKNLRICENCHRLMKSISKVYEREIVIRDCTRFHQFVGGHCSCKDYW